jgi:flagellar hook assembly protein FlgD
LILSYGAPSDVPQDGTETENVTAPRITGAHPNPASSATSIAFDLPASGRASVAVYDAAGRLVAKLAEREFPAGRSSVRWDGRDATGRPMASGIYFARLTSDGGSASSKLVLLR